MSLACVTNDMDDIRSCTVKGEHEIVCDGWQYHYDSGRGIERATGKECKGCLPREAKKGMLCWGCWERVEQAFADWTPQLQNALTYDRLVQRDNAGVRSQIVGYVNMPATALALDEINSYLKSCKTTADLWVCTVDGAKDAVRFSQAVPRAKRTHEVEERERQLRRVRCPDCEQLSFVRNPPTDYKEPVLVKCQNDACGKTITDKDTTVGDELKLVVIAQIERIAG